MYARGRNPRVPAYHSRAKNRRKLSAHIPSGPFFGPVVKYNGRRQVRGVKVKGFREAAGGLGGDGAPGQSQ